MSDHSLMGTDFATMREFLANESEPETPLERVVRVSNGERACCADPDCPVWSDEWLEGTDA